MNPTLISAVIAVTAWVPLGPPALGEDNTDQRFGTGHFAASCNETAYTYLAVRGPMVL